MKPFAALLLALYAVGATANAVAAEAGTSIDERIDQGLRGTVQADPAAAPSALDDADVSLIAPTGRSRLRTTLDPIDIEQRIDKGLTAAGEESVFPPDYAYGAFQRGWFLTAFSLAIDRAKLGDTKAQTLLGVLLSRGLGVKQDLTAAADWFGLAGKSGDPEALYALGQIYLDGEGATQDFAEAAEFFRQAADKGHSVAARELGYLLLEGKGQEKNAMLAAAYLRRAAGLGDMDAQYTLAGLYVEGVGVVADEKQAARWFAEAAKNGHVGAEVEYAIMLFNGRGVTKDEAGAAFWFARAADADNPAAQIRLARLLADGRGVDMDQAGAARWYLIAKDHGLEDDFMEDWLRKIDVATRAAARAAADDWARLRRGVLQAAAAAPNGERAPMDNPIE